MDSGETFLQWDKNLSELSEAGDNDILYSTVSGNLLMIAIFHFACFDVLQLVSDHPECI